MRTLRSSLALFALLAVAASRQTGSGQFCAGGRLHSLRYDTQLAVQADSIVELDKLAGLKDLECDNSRLKIIFHDEIHSTGLWTKIKLGNVYLTGGEKHGCPLQADPSRGFLMRRVNSAQLYGQAVITQVSPAQYDEIYSDASIDYGSRPHQDCLADAQVDAPICIGVNSDASCKQAAAPLPIFSDGIISLACDSCFAGLSADVFFSIKIKGFELQSLEGGFRNITANAGLDVAFQAQKSWSVGVNKNLLVAGGANNPVVSFKIGPVPFVFWFEVDQGIQGSAQLQASAQAQAGVAMQYDIGDSFISWDPDNHWVHHHPNPSLLISPTISGSAQFNGQASLSLVPTAKLHVNQLFTYGLQINPGINMQIQGDTASKKICESVDYAVQLTSEAELHLNIGWGLVKVSSNKQWGPSQIWAKNGTISQACVAAKGTSL